MDSGPASGRGGRGQEGPSQRALRLLAAQQVHPKCSPCLEALCGPSGLPVGPKAPGCPFLCSGCRPVQGTPSDFSRSRVEQCMPGPAPSLGGEDGPPPGQTKQLDSREAGRGLLTRAATGRTPLREPFLFTNPLASTQPPGTASWSLSPGAGPPAGSSQTLGAEAPTSGPWNRKHAGPSPPFAHKTESILAGPGGRAWHGVDW